MEKLNKNSSSARVRTRAHAILLSSEGFTIEELMEIFHVKRDTISRWLNNWEQYNFEGLQDKMRKGRTPTLNKNEENILKQLIFESPRSSKVVAQQLLNKTGKNLSHWSIKRLAKKFGLSWKRIRKSLKSKRDIDEFNKAISVLEALERVAMKNAKNENKAELNTKASDSDIEVFKRLVNIDLIDEEKNIKKVVKLETNEVVTKTNSSLSEVAINSASNDEGYQSNETNELQTNPAELESDISNLTIVLNCETEEGAIACQTPETNEINPPKMITGLSEVETDFAPKLNTDKPFNKDILDVVYFDATGFDLVPSVPYAWQYTGRKNTICVPSSKSKRINVLGFLNKINNELTPFVIEATVNTDVVVEVFETFSKQIHNPTLVVMDNASIHTSHHFFEQIENWQKKGLFPYFLPTYSPELNAIEILWRKIKYEWLPFSAYESFKKLQEAVDEVLIHFGSKYLITFA